MRVVDGVDARRARGGARAADGADLRAGRPDADNSELSRQGDGADRQGQGRADPGRRRRRDPDHPERPPGNGATLVAYSGGKCLRGPQTAGLLLGRKDLVKAAWVHSAPHHGPHRGYKVGKEEAIGMLAAVETWVKRDHDAEWKRWTGWLEHIAAKVKTVDGVTTESPSRTACRTRRRRSACAGIAPSWASMARRVVRTLFNGEPRITMTAAGGASRRSIGDGGTGVSITPYMMAAGDEQIVADRLYALLIKPPAHAGEDAGATPAADLSGGGT